MGTVKYTGPVASFHCPTSAEIRSLKVHFSPKQLGSGDPSPENVREIVGWDGVEVYRNDSTTNYEFGVLGKNKFPLRATNQFLDTTTGSSNTIARDMTTGDVYVNISSNNYWQGKSSTKYGISIGDGSLSFHSNDNSYGVGVFVPVFPSTTYTLSHSNFDNGRTRVGYYDADGHHLNVNISKDSNVFTFTTDANTKYILIVFCSKNNIDSDYTVSNIQLELGSIATAYEPYNPNKTVYGGWVDLISGEVCEEYEKKVLDGTENWQLNGWSKNGVYIINRETDYDNRVIPYRGSTADEIFCNMLNPIASTYFINTDKAITIQAGDYLPNYSYLLLYNSEWGQTIEEYKAALKNLYDNGTPVEVVAPLKTDFRQTYYLPPYSIALQTFLGQNNVWSNADYVEVEYDLHETQDILARKQFIMANQPHIVKPVAAPLQNFVTDMAAPLKECKAYFKPIQDLHGYDKPWIGGSGKNLFNINASMQDPSDMTLSNTTKRIFTPNTYSVGGSYSNWWQPTKITNYSISNSSITVTSSTGYGVCFAIKAKPETYYTVSATVIGTNPRINNAYYDSEGNYLGSASTGGNITTFQTPENTDMMVIIFAPVNNTEATFSNIQVEEGQTATAYEPWENVCPISGWTELEAYRTEKSLVRFADSIGPTNRLYNGFSGWSFDGYWKIPDRTQTYTYSVYIDNKNTENDSCVNVWFRNETNTAYVRTVNGSKIKAGEEGWSTLSFNNNNYYFAGLGISLQAGGIAKSGMLEIGNTATTYESYNGTTIPITFPSEAGTIYGGYVDLVKGEVWQTWAYVEVDENTSFSVGNRQNSAGKYFYLEYSNMPDKQCLFSAGQLYQSLTVEKCNRFMIDNPWGQSSSNNYTMWAYTSGATQTTVRFGFPQSENIETVADAKTWLTEHGSLVICYPLAAPVLVGTINPVTLKALRGTNNIWSNSNGPVEVQFWRH